MKAAGVLLARRPAQRLAVAGAGADRLRVHIIEGGYKAFRAAMLAQLPALAQRFLPRGLRPLVRQDRLLQALDAAGAQVLDLEALASHRSSVLGLIPAAAADAEALRHAGVGEAARLRSRRAGVESESKKVGNLAVPRR